MERLSDKAIEIINALHTERLDYVAEYLPLIEAANRLAEYEDASDNGLLIKMPCKVGDSLYYTKDLPFYKIIEVKVIGVYYEKGKIFVDVKARYGTWIHMPIEEFCRTFDEAKDYLANSQKSTPTQTTSNKKTRKYFRKCGICGERYEQSEMIRDKRSPNGWICRDCDADECYDNTIEEW